MTTTLTGDTVATWTALGCHVHIEVLDPAALATARALVDEVLRDVDEVASRFRDDSDLSLVNRHPGTWVEVDPLLVAAVEVALGAAATSGGLVHPLLGRPMVELGYDRDLGALVPREHASDSETPPPALDAWRQVELGLEAGVGRLRIPPATALDLGATGKAWCADLAVTALVTAGIDAALVSVGGDLRATGDQPWTVAVSEHPDGPVDALVELRDGALATSSTRVRRWTSGGLRRHHLLDPRTGLPCREVWRTVTVAADTCVAANTAATAIVVAGSAEPELADPVLVDPRARAARLVAADGRVSVLGAWPTEATR